MLGLDYKYRGVFMAEGYEESCTSGIWRTFGPYPMKAVEYNPAAL